MVDIDRIYAPVQDGLALTEQAIQGIVCKDGSFLAKLLAHILRGGGKRMRPAITLLAGKVYDYNLKTLVCQAAGVETLHTATLVHDDTIDKSSTRRSKVTVNAAWGDARAILLGDYLLAKAAELTAMTENVRVIKLCARTLMTISGGELEQSAFDFNLDRVRDQYFRWIADKTADLFAMAAESGAILGGAPEDSIRALRDYGYNLGIAFQVVDDVLDFAGDEKLMGKPTGEDLRQGIVTLPAILYLEAHRNDKLVMGMASILKSMDLGKLRELTRRVQASPYLKDCSDIAGGYASRAREALKTLPDNQPRQSLLDLVDYALQRNK